MAQKKKKKPKQMSQSKQNERRFFLVCFPRANICSAKFRHDCLEVPAAVRYAHYNSETQLNTHTCPVHARVKD